LTLPGVSYSTSALTSFNASLPVRLAGPTVVGCTAFFSPHAGLIDPQTIYPLPPDRLRLCSTALFSLPWRVYCHGASLPNELLMRRPFAAASQLPPVRCTAILAHAEEVLTCDFHVLSCRFGRKSLQFVEVVCSSPIVQDDFSHMSSASTRTGRQYISLFPQHRLMKHEYIAILSLTSMCKLLTTLRQSFLILK